METFFYKNTTTKKKKKQGKFPSELLLRTYGLSSVFQPLMDSIKLGRVADFDKCMEANASFFAKLVWPFCTPPFTPQCAVDIKLKCLFRQKKTKAKAIQREPTNFSFNKRLINPPLRTPMLLVHLPFL